MRPLPAEPFVLASWARAKVGPDIHAQVNRVLYSVPWRHLGKTADVRITASMVQFFIGGELVKTHPRKMRGKQTDFADYPPVIISFNTPCFFLVNAGLQRLLRMSRLRACPRAYPEPQIAGGSAR